MDKKVELAKAIGSFIEKYWKDDSRVAKPKMEFVVNGVYQVENEIDLLKEVNTGLWTFYGSAIIAFTDNKSKVVLNKKSTIKGNAKVQFYPNAINEKELLPDVKSVTITRVVFR